MQAGTRTASAVAITVLLMMLLDPATTLADSRSGAQFSERWCSQCHGVKPNQASPYSSAPSFSDLANSPSTTRYSLTVSLKTTPHWTMPKIKLKSRDINNVVSYILTLRHQR
jgi:mono/diheme cytochrome c family protein